jgi:hypothetical protein
MNRKVATYGPSNLIKLAAEEAASIGKLMRGSRFRQQEVEVSPGVTKMVSKKDLWQDWERIVKASRDIPDPATGKPGYFFQNPVELDNAYMQHIKRLPSDAEAEAYFAYKRFLELDRVIRNIAVYRNKARVGAETHSIGVLGEDGKIVRSADFEGVLRKDMPGGNDTIMITGAKEGKETFVRGNDPQYIKIRKSLENDVKEGRKKVIEVYDPEQRPLDGFASVGDKRVRYIITDNVESKALSWEQVPRRGGGHFDYDYDQWIKQAKIRPENIDGKFHHWYEGDTTVMPVSLRAMGADIAEKLNTVRELIRDGKAS